MCVSWFKFLCQVLSRDLAATLSTLAGELSRSDSEDTLEEQAAVLLELPCKRAVLREAAESSIAGSRPSRCPARLFAPFAFQQTSNKCCRRPRSLHCDSTLWKRRGGAFRPQGQPWLDAIYHLVVGAITGVLPVFTSPKRTSWCSRGQDSASAFLRTDLKSF